MRIEKRTGMRPCVTCGRSTRPETARASDFPHTVIRRGDVCSNCANRKTTNGRMPISREPLTVDELVVVAMMRRLSDTVEEADGLIAMLGLAREATA